jgi:thioredoxin-related protein
MRTFFLSIFIIGFVSCKQSSKEVKTDATVVEATSPPVEVQSTPATTAGLTWVDIKTAATHKNEAGKMYFVDVYTDWCGWCKVMDKKTFSDPVVQKALNDRFIAVKFDAEQKEAVMFNNKNYEWQSMGKSGINTLALELLGEEMSFPSYVFLDKNRKPFKVSKGFMPSEQFLAELNSVK